MDFSRGRAVMKTDSGDDHSDDILNPWPAQGRGLAVVIYKDSSQSSSI